MNTRAGASWTPEDLLPHGGPAVWLQRVLGWGEDWAEAEVDRHPEAYCGADGRAPAWLGLEYLAQTIGVHVGALARRAGRAPKLGFLMGVNRYDCEVPAFAPGEVLRLRVECRHLDEHHVALYHGWIWIGAWPVVSADIKAVQPEDPLALIER